MMPQCIPKHQHCDNVENCINGVDEQRCPWMNQGKWTAGIASHHFAVPPLLVHITQSGIQSVNFTPLSGSRQCPDTHFQCPGHLLCLPVFVRCNGVQDCPGHEDEAECEAYSVPGFYRCRASSIHLHLSQMCDGFGQCPQKDDELLCNETCPLNCTCFGNAFFCASMFPVHKYGALRFLDGRGSGMKPDDFANNSMLVHLGLASCGLTELNLPTLLNLRSLDLSDNQLHGVNNKDLGAAEQLSTLSLSGNPLNLQFLVRHKPLLSLTVLDLSNLHLPLLNVNISIAFPNVQKLNVSGSGVQTVSGTAFQRLNSLRVLDLRGCPFDQFPRDVFSGLQDLEIVHSDNYKVCCSDVLPKGFNLKNCHAPSDEVSSCDALLQSSLYRILTACFATSSLLENSISFIYHVLSKKCHTSGNRVFMIQLCVSDFLMGVYLAIIGIADGMFRGSYLWMDKEWRHSAMCQVTGVLFVLSCEVSAFIIFLITLDRFLVLQFPFSRCHFSHRSALVVCSMVWCGCLILAGAPLLPGLSHWQYYSQSGICIPLPITRKQFGGNKYFFGVMIVFNFLISLLIVLGQLSIYCSTRNSTFCASDTTANGKGKDLIMARRLFNVVMSDFLCWFSFGLLGLLASQGVMISGEINVAMAIIVLPLNSTLNPLLYTLSLIQERRRRAKELRLQKRLMAERRQLSSCQSSARGVEEILKLTYTKEEVCLLLQRWLHDRLLSKEQLHESLIGFVK